MPKQRWVYECRVYDSKSVASYVAICMNDDMKRNGFSGTVQVFRTRRGNYGIRYRQREGA